MAGGRLFLIPVPIAEGDPADTLPAATIEAARSCTRFLAENAKSARAFLKAVAHPQPIAELEIIEIGHEPDPARFSEWLAPVAAGTDTAIVSESGCPAVADPGADVVAIAQRKQLRVVPLVGPSSIILSVMASGFNGQSFAFNGYLPIETDERTKKLKLLEQRAYNEHQTQLFIETPYRNNKMVEDIIRCCRPQTKLCIAANITCPDEYIRTKSIQAWKGHVPDLSKIPCIFLLYR